VFERFGVKWIVATVLVSVSPVFADGAAAILEAAGVRGGLVVVVGCDDPGLLVGLRASDAFLVHALDTDAGRVAGARRHIRAKKLYGRVSAAVFDGASLPYVDGLVNLLVVRDGAPKVTGDEAARVLAPGGTVVAGAALKPAPSSLVPRRAAGLKGAFVARKRRPAEIDEWTHFLHGPDNNAVARDARIDVPRRAQWIGGPKWSRHHDRMAGLSAAVSAGGRLFYIMDEGPIASALAEPNWQLTARDAFNGVTLWKLRISDWWPHLWPLKSGPAWLPRRLVACGGHVYVTLGLHAPVTQIDAATGKTVRTYSETKGASEILFDDGLLLVSVDEAPKTVEYTPRVGMAMGTVGMERDQAAKNYPWDWAPKRVMAIAAATGKVLWSSRSPVAPVTLSMNRRHVFFHDGEAIVCLSRSTGEPAWRTTPASSLQGNPRNWYAKTVKVTGKLGKALPASFAPNLVLHEDVVLFSGGDGKLCGLDAGTGKALWVGQCLASGHYSSEDVLVAGGLVWTAEIAHSRSSGKVVGLDPKTGKVKRTITCDAKIGWFHQRCYRSKATERYLLTSRNGIEFIDVETGRWTPNHWVRGGCLYGILPCNGLIYTPPHNCACYVESKLFGFNALAAKRSKVEGRRSKVPRFEKGPAYGEAIPKSAIRNPQSSWPVFRHDNRRSGAASTVLGETLVERWRAELPARASQPVIANNRLLVAVPDRHAVVCLAADTGKRLWRFTADARVDSPPAIAGELCVFGSADGRVYCLTMDGGKLVWRFRAAADERRIAAFGQLENVSPVSGSVLVRGEEVVFAAGRSVFLDGGLRMIRLDLRSGKLLSERVMDDRDPENPGRGFQYRQKGLSMPVGLPDILSCDETSIYMRSQPFDLKGKRRTLAAVASTPPKGGEGSHIFSPTGFLDDSWMHRSYWVYGTGFDEGAGGWPRAGKVVPAGRILCHDRTSIYGYGRKTNYFQWSTPLEYHLFAAARSPAVGRKGAAKSRVTYRWSRASELHVMSMLVAGDTLYIAGPPVVIDEAKAYKNPLDEKVRAAMAEQVAALGGRRGGILQVVAAEDGRKITQMTLDYLPAFDGMAAAGGRLFVVSHDGKLVCYGGKR